MSGRGPQTSGTTAGAVARNARLLGNVDVDEAKAEGAVEASVRRRDLGAIFTRRWVAELVLDLAGYDPDLPLFENTILEPACGHGAFLDLIVERLVKSCRRAGKDLATTADAIVALDLDPVAVRVVRDRVRGQLAGAGLQGRDIDRLLKAWIKEGDFLKSATRLPSASWVVGNPPYLRIEDVSRADMAIYREAWPTMSGRADVYVGFYEAGLSKLAPGGKLAFICADRWMRNQYGAALRSLVEAEYAVETCVVMHAVDAFEDRVSAYPAITVLAAGVQGDALVVQASDEFDGEAATRLVKAQARGPAPLVVDPSFRASWLTSWPRGGASWPAGEPEQLQLLHTLEATFPTLAETGAFVSVGTATGADDVYVVDDPDLVEPSLMFPALAARETTHGGIDWRGRYIISPWTGDGLALLEDYPLLRAYFEEHRERLERRHVAKNNPDRWWRTIDRIDPATAGKPKLLIPDLKDRIHPVYDQGKYVPLHSLYYVTSDTWDLAVLGGLLMSATANLFVEAYSVRMANGYMRVSAQYLRRVRVPRPETLQKAVSSELRAAFWSRDAARASAAALDAYRPSSG